MKAGNHNGIACPRVWPGGSRTSWHAGTAIVLPILLFLSVNAFGHTPARGYEPSEIVQKAQVICTATVMSTHCQWKSDYRGNHIYTNAELLVGRTMKGGVPDHHIRLEVVGGTAGDITESVSDSAVFAAGEQVLLFLDGEPLRVVGGIMGKMPIFDDQVFWGGRKVTLEALSTSLALGVTEVPAAPGEDTPSGEKNARPTITRIVPDIGSAGTGTQVTISGAAFGESRDYGKVEFFYRNGEPRIEASAISSWSDTQIICTVPIDIVNNYPASASSGPVTVTTGLGTSSGYPFRVTFGYDGQYWWGANPAVLYYVNENTSDCPGEGAVVQAAAETWNSTGASFRFYYAGPHTNTTASRNGQSEIMWGTTPPRALAVTYNMWTRRIYDLNGFPVGDQIIECDMVFNDRDFDWSTSPSDSEADIQSVALHELGHFLSLRDLYGDAGDGEYDAAKIMHGRYGLGSLTRDLHPDDVAGIHWIYPPGSPPVAPDSIAYPSSDDDGVYIISWPTRSTASSYQLERSTNGSGTDWVQVYSGPHTYFEDTVDNGGYRYRAAASNAAGVSTWQTGNGPCLVQLLWEGSGEPNDPFLIRTAEQLDRIGTHSRWWSKHFKLTADIDLSGYDGRNGRAAFQVIAPGDKAESWTGVFDGNDHVVSNFTYVSSRPGHGGFFGRMATPDAEIKRLKLVGSRVERMRADLDDRVGSLVGFLEEGTVAACSADGAGVGGKVRVGGLVGENVNGTIVNCYADAHVSGIDDVGGLVGYNSGYVSASFSVGTVSGEGWGIGGLAGSNNPGGVVVQCYSLAAVGGVERVGGLVGDNNGGTVTQCYSSGAVGGRWDVGGLVGGGKDSVTFSFWDIQTSGQATSAGGAGMTTAEMQTAKTFLDAGWDFMGETANGTQDIWWILEGQDYPRLWWQAK